MTRDQYCAIPNLNWSVLKHALRSPAHLKAALTGSDEEKEPTEAQLVGQTLHAFVLEGKKFDDLYAIKPAGMKFNTREGKAWRDAQTKPIITEETALGIPRMAEAIANHRAANWILNDCPRREHCYTAELEGVAVKGLLDADGDRMFLDVKTCEDASPEAFAKTVYNYGYAGQLSFYADLKAMALGLEEAPRFAIIAAEKKPPYAVMVYELDQAAIEFGRQQYSKCLRIYKECLESGEWPGYADDVAVQTLSLPAWAKLPE